jgi:hypothetical protein
LIDLRPIGKHPVFFQVLRNGAGSTGQCNTIWYKSFLYKVVFMTFKRRVKLSEQQRNDMWRRWKAGQSLHEIGRVFGKDHVSIQFMLAQHGGIAPAVRRRSPLRLAARRFVR